MDIFCSIVFKNEKRNLSIILPTLNEYKNLSFLLPELVEMLEVENFENYEIIVVDDGSLIKQKILCQNLIKETQK